MHTLNVELGNRSYPVLIDAGLLGRTGVLDAHVTARDVLIVSNTTVAPLYLPAVSAALAPRRLVPVILPDGEAHKTLGNLARVLDVLVANRFGRDCAVLALGGGVVGDLAGFAAASYQRGVAFVQVPTTLLALEFAAQLGFRFRIAPATRLRVVCGERSEQRLPLDHVIHGAPPQYAASVRCNAASG